MLLYTPWLNLFSINAKPMIERKNTLERLSMKLTIFFSLYSPNYMKDEKGQSRSEKGTFQRSNGH